MSKEKEDPTKAAAAAAEQVHVVPRERAHFRSLVVANPNYFGNLKLSAFPAVASIQGNNSYEEIGCVGFQPQFGRLDAVIFVKQTAGYGGGVCAAGTPEYVRFYVSLDGGASWVDQGLASFTAYDIPEGTAGPKRLEYAVSVPCQPPKKFCRTRNVLLARAILSWNDAPPADTPDFVPVWGDRHDTHIQVDPLRRFRLSDVFTVGQIELSAELAQVVDLDEPVSAVAAKSLSVAELATLYKGKGIEPHRFALAELHKLVSTPELTEGFKKPSFPGALAGIDVNLVDIVGKLQPTDGSTLYEELDCVGFNPVTSELSAVLRVKKPLGYSGGLCTQGSREYVTFWADLNGNGIFETCLGTASVRVHDITEVPSQGLEYAVFLPVDFGPYRRPCQAGPRLVPIRAILSWNVVPPCANPNYVPVWGNREDTLIQVPAGPPVQPGVFSPVLYEVSGASVCAIDQGTGLAIGDRPFGGQLCITGEIPAALALTVPDTLKYRVTVRDLAFGLAQPLIDPFGITVHEGAGLGVATSSSMTQSVDGANRYTYREYGTPISGAWRRVSSPNRLLAVWNTVAPMTGTWEIVIEAFDTLTNITYVAGITHCADGTTRQAVRVYLDEYKPTAGLTITDYSTDGGVTWQPAIACATFTKGVRIRGSYFASDAHFGSLGISVEPAAAAHGAAVHPSSRAYGAPDFVPTGGESGTWTLDTTPMDPCGYVVRMDVYDRTIVNCGTVWHDFATVGFCLKAPGSN